MCVAVSATIAAIAKKILFSLLGDEKGRKALSYAIGITLFILLLPVIATYGLFGWMASGETELLSPEMVYDNIPTEYREQIELYADELKKIETVFAEKELTEKQASAAKMRRYYTIERKEYKCYLLNSQNKKKKLPISPTLPLIFLPMEKK